MEESEKIDQILGPCQRAEKKPVKHIRVTVIPIVVSAQGMVSEGFDKRLELEIKARNEIIQTTELLKSDRILWRVLETRIDLLSLRP